MPTFRQFVTLCLVALMTFACAQTGGGQDREFDPLEQQVEGVRLRERNINLALSAVAREYRIPIGIEMAAGDKGRPNPEINIDLARGTLRQVLNAITEADTRYTWAVTDGVVNVYPKVNRDALLKDLLDTKVQSLKIDNNPTTYALRNRIVSVPEIKSKLAAANVAPFIVGVSSVDFERMGDDFSLSVSDITLQKLLNQIVRQSGVKFWILNRYGENNELLILNF